MAAAYHAHIYYSPDERAGAAALRTGLLGWLDGRDEARLDYVGEIAEGPVGPHPLPQYEVHFAEPARAAVTAAIAATGLRALVHPLSDDDLADHTANAEWIGEPLALDLTALDPPGQNRSFARFGEQSI